MTEEDFEEKYPIDLTIDKWRASQSRAASALNNGLDEYKTKVRANIHYPDPEVHIQEKSDFLKKTLAEALFIYELRGTKKEETESFIRGFLSLINLRGPKLLLMKWSSLLKLSMSKMKKAT